MCAQVICPHHSQDRDVAPGARGGRGWGRGGTGCSLTLSWLGSRVRKEAQRGEAGFLRAVALSQLSPCIGLPAALLSESFPKLPVEVLECQSKDLAR